MSPSAHSAMIAGIAYPVVYFVVYLLLIFPLTWLIQRYLPAGKFRTFLFKPIRKAERNPTLIDTRCAWFIALLLVASFYGWVLY